MHDLDRTQNLFETDSYETEFTFDGEAEFEGDFGYETDSPFNEVEEMEMAALLLEITDEAELDQFLGSLIKKAGRAAGKIIRSPLGKAIGGVLKGAAQQALPIIGTAIGGPVGGQLASAAGAAFGLELEGLSPQDQEFEVARRFVRFASATTKKAAQTPPNVPPQQAARKAAASAARKHAPGLIKQGGKQVAGRGQCTCPQAQAAAYGFSGQEGYPGAAGAGAATPSGTGLSASAGGAQASASGRWIRQNGQIILLGA